MLRIGLTGGIGCGKSSVANRFVALGVPVIDADEISRDLVQPGYPAYQAIIDAFGLEIVDANKTLDRAKLRQLIFSNPQAKVKLESILHPLIRAEISQQQSSLNTPYCVIAIPLLIETGQNNIVDRILVVDSSLEKQITRTRQRDGVSREQVEAIIATQVDGKTRRSVADDVIDNSGSLEQLNADVDKLHKHYLKMLNLKTLVENVNLTDNVASIENNPNCGHPDMTWLNKVQDEGNALKEVDAGMSEIVYELPLNEKIRTLIRLESLFEEIEFHMKGSTVWDTRSAVNTFVAICNVFARPEIKTDLMKEMDRINTTLSKYNAMNGVNTGRLAEVQENLGQMAKSLRAMDGQIGQGLKQNDFIMSIRQRDTIPGGALVMDLPTYGHWLAKDIDTRRKDIRGWLQEFTLVKKAMYLVLELVRDSATAINVVAKSGFYQHNLDTGTSNQILRVVLPKDVMYFPEISGGRHRFTVRFLKPVGFDRPVQIEQEIPFKLICCAL